LAALPPLTRLLFIYLWMLADKSGRLEDRPARIKKQAIGYDNADCEEMLCQLAASGFITRYTVGGEKFIQINNFTKHQTPHVREAESVLPSLDSAEPVQSTAKVVPEHSQGSDKASPRSPDSLIPDSLIPDTGFTDTTAQAPAPRKRGVRVSVPPSALESVGFTAEVAAEFIAYKAEVKAPLTERAWADHCREADKAGCTPQQAAEKVMNKGWKGFEARYVANEARPLFGQSAQPGGLVTMSQHGLQTMRAAEALEKRLFGGMDAAA
jgi:hypothetical protein